MSRFRAQKPILTTGSLTQLFQSQPITSVYVSSNNIIRRVVKCITKKGYRYTILHYAHHSWGFSYMHIYVYKRMYIDIWDICLHSYVNIVWDTIQNKR